MPHQPVGPVITDGAERLYRCVHPKFYDPADGRISSQAFEVFAKDEGLLSVHVHARAGSPVEAFERFLRNRGVARPCGVAMVTVGECRALDLPAAHDPVPDGDTDRPADDAHAVIDFRAHAPRQQEKRWKKLRDAAQVRGLVHVDRT